jgi:lactate dehydrogenase-like 2-hydroxyacid dehydrogenase
MKPTVLLATRISPSYREKLLAFYELIEPPGEPFDTAAQALKPEEKARVRAIVTLGSLRIGAEGMAAFPSLGLISCLGSGYESVDLPAAKARGITVTHSPSANAASVADIAVGLWIDAVRNLYAGRERLRQGSWLGNAVQPNTGVRGLTGRRVGIYGLGAIGLKIAQRCAAFETEVAYHNRKPRSDVPYAYHDSLLSLAKWADTLMIAVRAAPENRHAVNADVLAALGKDGFVINISRGLVIDEAALLQALNAGTIAGAGLDVFEHEPKVPGELLTLPHVAVLPHVGGATLEAQEAMQTMALENLAAFFAGRPIPNPVPE